MRTIARLTHEEAYLLKGRLEAEQIPAFILDEPTITGLPITDTVFGGMRVQVPDEHAERAENILRVIRENAPPVESETEPVVSRAQPILTVGEVVELILYIVFVAAVLYRFFSQ